MENYVYEVIMERIPKKLRYKCRKDGEHYLIMASAGNQVVSLNQTAYNILNLCDGNNTIGDVYNQLIKMYSNADEERLKSDVVNSIVTFEVAEYLTTVRKQF